MLDKDLSEVYKNLEDCFNSLGESAIWKSTVMKHYRLTEQSFKIAFDEFKAACFVAAEDHTTGSLMRYFSHWYPKNKERLFKVNVSQPKRI